MRPGAARCRAASRPAEATARDVGLGLLRTGSALPRSEAVRKCTWYFRRPLQRASADVIVGARSLSAEIRSPERWQELGFRVMGPTRLRSRGV